MKTPSSRIAMVVALGLASSAFAGIVGGGGPPPSVADLQDMLMSEMPGVGRVLESGQDLFLGTDSELQSQMAVSEKGSPTPSIKLSREDLIKASNAMRLGKTIEVINLQSEISTYRILPSPLEEGELILTEATAK